MTQGYIIETDRVLTVEEVRELEGRWDVHYRGLINAHRVFEFGVEFTLHPWMLGWWATIGTIESDWCEV